MIYFLILISAILYWYLITRRRHGEPPILAGSLPFVGHAYMLLGNSRQFWMRFTKISQECLQRGDALYVLIGHNKFYVLTDPDDISVVANACLEKDKLFGQLMKRLLGEGLVFASVPTWKKHRKLILPTFNQQTLDNYQQIFNNQAKVLVKRLENHCGGGPFDINEYLKHITLQTIFLTAMGLDINDEDASNYISTVDTAIEKGLEKFQKIWLHCDTIYKLTSLKKKEKVYLKTLRTIAESVLERKRKSFELTKNNNNNKDEKPNFLDQLVHFSFSDVLSDKEIIDEIHTMIMAGSDTSSTVLMFTLVLIGSHPKVQEKIVDELKNIFGDSDAEVQKNDLIQMTYLEAVIRESMRFYVLVPFVSRHIDREVKLKTCVLHPGTNCVFSIYGVHRHEMWGKDADEFRPERWLESDLPANANAFMAFSLGKRNCIGRTYAMMLLKITITHLLRRYVIRADPSQLQVEMVMLLKPVDGTNHVSIDNRVISNMQI